jgi:hypothetical protein
VNKLNKLGNELVISGGATFSREAGTENAAGQLPDSTHCSRLFVCVSPKGPRVSHATGQASRREKFEVGADPLIQVIVIMIAYFFDLT